jgi:ABC-type histidine transport system ATPase subunit
MEKKNIRTRQHRRKCREQRDVKELNDNLQNFLQKFNSKSRTAILPNVVCDEINVKQPAYRTEID